MDDNNLGESPATGALKFSFDLATNVFNNTDDFTGKAICFTGAGPYDIGDLISLVPDGIRTIDLSEQSLPLSVDLVFCVIGQSDFDEEDIRSCIHVSNGKNGFLPQEGFLDLVLFGNNWWTDFIDELNNSLTYHEGLEYVHSLISAGFTWPSTAATESQGFGLAESGAFQIQSQLHLAGYVIWDGSRQVKDAERWMKLTRAISEEKINLRDAANHIAGLSKLRKSQPNGAHKYSYAIGKWEGDLARLKREFYDGKNYTFEWLHTVETR